MFKKFSKIFFENHRSLSDGFMLTGPHLLTGPTTKAGSENFLTQIFLLLLASFRQKKGAWYSSRHSCVPPKKNLYTLVCTTSKKCVPTGVYPLGKNVYTIVYPLMRTTYIKILGCQCKKILFFKVFRFHMFLAP